MRRRSSGIGLFVITTLYAPLLVFSLRLGQRSAHASCRKPEPQSRRPDQMTVIINGFSEHRIPLIQSIAATYSTSPSVAAVILLWCNPSTTDETLSALSQNLSATVLRSSSSSLNFRFYPREIIRTRAVLITDDDIEPDPRDISFAHTVWKANPDRIVGFFARSHVYDLQSKSWIYTIEKEKYSIILTKFMILNYEYLYRYTCDNQYEKIRKFVDETNNCEDLVMNFVVADYTNKGPILVGVVHGVRDYGDARNEGEMGITEVGLSSRKAEHRKRRGECIREFHRLLGRMPLRYSYGSIVDSVGEQGLCEKGGKLVLCDRQIFRLGENQ